MSTLPLFTELRVWPGTAISSPLAMIAFLLLLAKTIGRWVMRNRPVASSALTVPAKLFVARAYWVRPPVAATLMPRAARKPAALVIPASGSPAAALTAGLTVPFVPVLLAP